MLKMKQNEARVGPVVTPSTADREVPGSNPAPA